MSDAGWVGMRGDGGRTAMQPAVFEGLEAVQRMYTVSPKRVNGIDECTYVTRSDERVGGAYSKTSRFAMRSTAT